MARTSPPLEISVQDTQARLAAGGSDRPRLVDVRDADEFAYCQIAGAELIPLPTVPTDARARLPDLSAEIIVYCHHGRRSLYAVEQLRALGYANAQSMAGGIDRWSAEIDSEVPRY